MLRQDTNRMRRFLPVLAVLVASIGLVQCDRETEAPEAIAPEVVPEIAIETRPLGPPPGLTRAELINALAQAASVHTAGSTAQGEDALVGRTFSLHLPFGCSGPSTTETPENAIAQWTWGPGQDTIRLTMTPGDWTTSPLVAGAVTSTDAPATATVTWEAVEGFWIARPWLATEACPASTLSQSISAPPSPQTAGLASVFTTDSSRLGRRDGRAYTHVIRAEGDVPLAPPAAGYRLVLEGRVVAFPNGRATRCVSYSPDQRPTCVAAVQLDKVAFEDGTTGETLSEWRPGA